MPNTFEQVEPQPLHQSDWEIVSSVEARRPLDGAELLVNYEEYHNEGYVSIRSLLCLTVYTATDFFLYFFSSN